MAARTALSFPELPPSTANTLVHQLRLASRTKALPRNQGQDLCNQVDSFTEDLAMYESLCKDLVNN